MKFLSQLFEARGTAWTSNAFSRARTKLIFLYLTIIGVVIAIFAGLVVLQVNEAFTSTQIPPDSRIVMTATDAETKAKELKLDSYIERTTYSLEDNTLLYKITFDDESEVEIDLLTGTAIIGDTPDSVDEEESLFELLTDDIDETIGWLGLLVFLGAGLGSIIIAHYTLRPIAESVERQKRFVSDASHELRNPLAAILTTLESYTRSNNTDQAFSKSVAEDVILEVKRLINLSEALLSFERPEQSTSRLQAPVEDVLQSVVHRLTPLLDEKLISITKKIAPTPIKMSDSDLHLVLYNLIHNAIKFSKSHTTITITWDGTTLVIGDEGVGIAPDHLPHIFDRFYKADTSRGFSEYSTGLGLALVHDRVLASDGSIEVDSTLQKGTTFSIKM